MDALQRARQGDEQAFAELFEYERPKLLRVAAGIVGNSDAEDVVSDAYLKARDAIRDFNPRRSLSFPAWLSEIVKNLAFDSLKRGKESGPRKENGQEDHDDGQEESGGEIWTRATSKQGFIESIDDPSAIVHASEVVRERLKEERKWSLRRMRIRTVFLGRAKGKIHSWTDDPLQNHALRIVDDPRAVELLDALLNAGGRITVGTFLVIVRICAKSAEPWESISPRTARSIVKKDAGREPVLRSVAARKVRGGTVHHKYELAFMLEGIFRALCGGRPVRRALALASGMTYGKEWTPDELKIYRDRAREAFNP